MFAQIPEPILVWAANRYMETEAPAEMDNFLLQRLAEAPDASAQGKIWEKSIPSAVLSLFANPENSTNIVWAKRSYVHEPHLIPTTHDLWRHKMFGMDSQFSSFQLADWIADPTLAAFVFPENDAGPDAATVTDDGILVLIQCKFNQPPSVLKKNVRHPSAVHAIAAVMPSTFYRPRSDVKTLWLVCRRWENGHL